MNLNRLKLDCWFKNMAVEGIKNEVDYARETCFKFGPSADVSKSEVRTLAIQ